MGIITTGERAAVRKRVRERDRDRDRKETDREKERDRERPHYRKSLLTTCILFETNLETEMHIF